MANISAELLRGVIIMKIIKLKVLLRVNRGVCVTSRELNNLWTLLAVMMLTALTFHLLQAFKAECTSFLLNCTVQQGNESFNTYYYHFLGGGGIN